MGGKGQTQPAVVSAGQDNPAAREHARDELVRSHMPLVHAMARRYGGRGEELEDLVQVGALGLVRASARFDPGRGVAFASFAGPAVEGEIRRHLRDRPRGLRLPRRAQRMSTELRRARGELANALGRSPTVAELAAALDADEREIERLIAADLARDPVAIPADDSAGALPGHEHESTEKSEYRVLLAGGLRVLDERERRIVFLRFHADMTERQIARTLDISQAHVSRLLAGALAKLRSELAGSTHREISADSTESAVISAPEGTKIRSVRAQGERVGANSERTNRSPADAADAAASEPGAGDSTSSGRKSGRGKAAAGYSGRILVRMPSELHEQLAQAAEREEMSLNRYVTQALSGSLGTERDHAPLQGRTLRLALATNFAIVVVAAVAAVVLLVLALQRGL